MRKSWLLGLLVLSLGCGSSVASTEGGIVAVAPTHPVIGQLRTRDRTITLLSSREGLRVTLADSSGNIIARDIALDDLKDADPLAYELCRSSYASNAPAPEGQYLDARLDLSR